MIVSSSASAWSRSYKGRILPTTAFHSAVIDVRGFHNAGLLIAA
jgi:hypothetical protein